MMCVSCSRVFAFPSNGVLRDIVDFPSKGSPWAQTHDADVSLASPASEATENSSSSSSSASIEYLKTNFATSRIPDYATAIAAVNDILTTAISENSYFTDYAVSSLLKLLNSVVGQGRCQSIFMHRFENWVFQFFFHVLKFPFSLKKRFQPSILSSWISRVFSSDSIETKELSNFLYKKTRGNLTLLWDFVDAFMECGIIKFKFFTQFFILFEFFLTIQKKTAKMRCAGKCQRVALLRKFI